MENDLLQGMLYMLLPLCLCLISAVGVELIKIKQEMRLMERRQAERYAAAAYWSLPSAPSSPCVSPLFLPAPVVDSGYGTFEEVERQQQQKEKQGDVGQAEPFRLYGCPGWASETQSIGMSGNPDPSTKSTSDAGKSSLLEGWKL
ncbi:hypothetical protein PT974_04420 [Cladobotryum mycophilum]|uniref:Uncharacterized protein n=1 Tax=Cladobotryum mycophilum TaxID=491253 RepID=A0ABR0SV10_9HYPO